MARVFVRIDTASSTQKYGTKLVLCKDALRDVYNRLLEIRAIIANNNDGATFTDIETLFGLPAGKGQQLATFFTNAVAAFEGTAQNDNLKQMTEVLG